MPAPTLDTFRARIYQAQADATRIKRDLDNLRGIGSFLRREQIQQLEKELSYLDAVISCGEREMKELQACRQSADEALATTDLHKLANELDWMSERMANYERAPLPGTVPAAVEKNKLLAAFHRQLWAEVLIHQQAVLKRMESAAAVPPPQPATVTFRLLSSSDDPVTVDLTRNWLSALARNTTSEITFRLIATGQPPEVFQTVSMSKEFAREFEHLLLSHFEHAVLEPQDDPWPPAEALHPYRLTARLTSMPDYDRPDCSLGLLRPFSDFNPDPFLLFCSLAEQLQAGEFLAVVISLARPSEGFSRLLRSHDEAREYERKKASRPHWAAGVSLAAEGAGHWLQTLEQKFLRAYDITIGQYTHHLEPWSDHLADRLADHYYHQHSTVKPQNSAIPHVCRGVISSQFPPYEWPKNLVSTDELAGLVHLPHKSITSPLLLRANMQSQKVPDELTTPDGLLLGTNDYRHQVKQVYSPHKWRNRHTYIVGGAGSGKSTLLIHLIKQDMEQGRGLVVIDPHGDLIADVLPHVPAERVKDTILFDPTDSERLISLNPLMATTPKECERVGEEFRLVFQRLFVSGDAPRMLNILTFTVRALLESGGKTFFDIRRMLTSADYRASVVATLKDPLLKEFWEEEFPTYPKGATDPITNKFSHFMLNSTMRGILGQADSRLNFADLMQQRKILLVNLSKGEIGEENSQVLGSLLVSQVQLAAMRRASMPQEARVPFMLYIDEFQNFMSSAFEVILSEARKYNLCLTIAHQYTSQLSDSVRAAIFSNVVTSIFFKVGLQDANYLRQRLGAFTPEQAANLTRGQTIVSITEAGQPFSMQTFPPPPKPAVDFSEEIMALTQYHYGPHPLTAEPPATEGSNVVPIAPLDPVDPPSAAPEPTQRAKPGKKAAAAGGPEKNIFDDLLGSQ